MIFYKFLKTKKFCCPCDSPVALLKRIKGLGNCSYKIYFGKQFKNQKDYDEKTNLMVLHNNFENIDII